MGLIGNTVGDLRYVDLPITAGATPSVTFTTDRVLDLVGVAVIAPGATAAATTVSGTTVAGAAIASFTKNAGAAVAAAPAGGVAVATTDGTGGNGAPQKGQTNVGYQNYAASGVIQGFATSNAITDRNGSVPNPAALTPLQAAIPGPVSGITLSAPLSTGGPITSVPVNALSAAVAGGSTLTVTSADGAHTQNFAVGSAGAAANATSIPVTSQTPNFAYATTSTLSTTGAAVTVSLTGTVTALLGLPAADGNGFINMPTGVVEGITSTLANLPADSVVFRVKASDIPNEATLGGSVRLIFNVPVSDPNAAAKTAGTYPVNGIQRGSLY